MKDTTKFKSWLAALITIAVIVLAFKLLDVEVKAGSRDVLNVLIGMFAGVLKDIYAYYFGSSEGSEQKTKLLAQAPPIQASEELQ